MLERIIQHLFSLHDYSYSYCEYYGCCQTAPCRYNKLLQKHHDGQLKFPQGLGRYVALYRADAILQIDALYRYDNSSKHGEYDQLIHPDETWWQSEKYIRSLVALVNRDFGFHRRFISRWVSNSDPTILSMEYYDFVKQPKINTRKILKHLFPDAQFGDAQIDRALEVEQPRIVNQMPQAVFEKVKQSLAQ